MNETPICPYCSGRLVKNTDWDRVRDGKRIRRVKHRCIKCSITFYASPHEIGK